MNLKQELFLIPCCKKKNSAESSQFIAFEPLKHLVSEAVYSDVLDARRKVLSCVIRSDQYMSHKYEVNQCLKLGPDLGGRDMSGLYLPSVERYQGYLYSKAPKLSSRNHPDTHIIILSALYGPLHPLSHIQDYNLRMEDSPAYGVWKECLIPFLRCYVLSNNIRRVHLLFGSSTKYLTVAEAAVEPLLKDRVIEEAIQYHVNCGSSRVTPETHGKLLEGFLTQERMDGLPDNIEARPLLL